MPKKIFQSLIRTYFLDVGLDTFFDKVYRSLIMRKEYNLYTGQIRKDMKFSRAVPIGRDPYDRDGAIDLEILDVYANEEILVSYFGINSNHKVRTVCRREQVDFFI